MRRLMPNVLITRNLPSTDSEKRGQCEKNHKSNESITIKIRTVRSSVGLSFIKGLMSNSRQSDRHSRMATRRFSSAHIVGIRNVKPFDLSGVNSSAVISAWHLSSPCVDFFAANADIHREFGADFRNLIPADSDLAERVSNCDSLIKDSHLGAHKGEVKEIADKQRPTQGCDKAIKSFHQETLSGETSTNKIDETGEEVTTSRTVDLRISHASSLSRKVVR